MIIFKLPPGKLKRREIRKAIIKPMTRTREYSNSHTQQLNETEFHLMMKFKNNLFGILVDTGTTHSYVGEKLL